MAAALLIYPVYVIQVSDIFVFFLSIAFHVTVFMQQLARCFGSAICSMLLQLMHIQQHNLQ